MNATAELPSEKQAWLMYLLIRSPSLRVVPEAEVVTSQLTGEECSCELLAANT